MKEDLVKCEWRLHSRLPGSSEEKCSTSRWVVQKSHISALVNMRVACWHFWTVLMAWVSLAQLMQSRAACPRIGSTIQFEEQFGKSLESTVWKIVDFFLNYIAKPKADLDFTRFSIKNRCRWLLFQVNYLFATEHRLGRNNPFIWNFWILVRGIYPHDRLFSSIRLGDLSTSKIQFITRQKGKTYFSIASRRNVFLPSG